MCYWQDNNFNLSTSCDETVKCISYFVTFRRGWNLCWSLGYFVSLYWPVNESFAIRMAMFIHPHFFLMISKGLHVNMSLGSNFWGNFRYWQGNEYYLNGCNLSPQRRVKKWCNEILQILAVIVCLEWVLLLFLLNSTDWAIFFWFVFCKYVFVRHAWCGWVKSLICKKSCFLSLIPSSSLLDGRTATAQCGARLKKSIFPTNRSLN